MKTKTKEKKIPFQIHPISAWSMTRYTGPLYINPGWMITTYEGMSLDVEDDEQGNFVGIGLYDPALKSGYWFTDFELVKRLDLKPFIAHNGMSDILKLQKWGFKVSERFLCWDTQIMAHIIDSSRKAYGLKKLVKEDLSIEYPSYEDLCGKKENKSHTTLDKLDPTLVAEYNYGDTYTTHKLYERQKASITPEQTEYSERIEKPVASIFSRMQQKGITIDLLYLKQLEADLSSKRQGISQEIKNELGDINLNSPKQLLEALNAKQIQPTLKGKPSTDKRALENFKNNPIVSKLLGYSEVDTLLSSFVNPYLERGQEVVHPRFNQCGTRTGRPSCSDPNLLQIPKRTDNGKLVRRMFVARDGCLLGDTDFGQIEPRVLAHLSKDKVLCQMFNNGVDFHTFTAERLGITRDRAKVLNLSVGYRATYKSVSQQLKCSWDLAQNEIDKWWSLFPELYDWEQRLIYDSKQSGYCTTLYGRRIKIDELDSHNDWRRESAERQLINNITQGTAAEIMKKAMIKVDKLNTVDVLIQVYDELVFEYPEEEGEVPALVVKEEMEHCVTLDVPLVVEAKVGKNWAEVF